MARVIAATLLGPADPRWDLCRERASEWADDHVIVEDRHGSAWGGEGPWREKLWNAALAACKRDDWIFVLDSDFVLTFDPHELTDCTSTVWNFRLFDLWDAEHYREDRYWRAHLLPRPWMFRASASPEPAYFGPRGIHVGHYPSNFPVVGGVRTPDRMAILHLGWMTPEVRQEKYDRYRKVWHQLSPHEREHVESIRDANPTLIDLPEQLQRSLWLKL